jgi:plasmid maintenance system killer protein
VTIDFDNPKHEELINNYDLLSKKYSPTEADDILATFAILDSADSLYDIPHTYHPHPLNGEYKGCFAIWVTKTHRTIFKPNHNGDPNFKIYNYKSISSITILQIYCNYHKK